MKELINLSLIETVKYIKNKKVSVKEVVESYINQLNKTKKYNFYLLSIIKYPNQSG